MFVSTLKLFVYQILGVTFVGFCLIILFFYELKMYLNLKNGFTLLSNNENNTELTVNNNEIENKFNNDDIFDENLVNNNDIENNIEKTE
jgi:hypothetical protein